MTKKPEIPSGGGSYVRNPDGKLSKAKPAPAPSKKSDKETSDAS